jgi:hypothetical protein
MFCRNCGNVLHENDKFCSKCGARVEPNEELNVNKGDSVLSEKVISSPFIENDNTDNRQRESSKEIPRMHWEEEMPKQNNSSGIEMIWDNNEDSGKYGNIGNRTNWEDDNNRRTGDVNFVWNTEEIPSTENRQTEAIKFDWSSVVDDKERKATKKIPAWRIANRTNPEEINREEERPYVEPVREEKVELEPKPSQPVYYQPVQPVQEQIKTEPIQVVEPQEIEEEPVKVIYEPEIPEEETTSYQPVFNEPNETIFKGLIRQDEIANEEEPQEKEEIKYDDSEEYFNAEVDELSVEEDALDAEADILDEPEYVSPFDEEDELDSELKELEKELFSNMEDDYVDQKATIKVDKFYTLDKKSEEFQSLLDKEYEKIKKSGVNYDLMDTDEEIIYDNDEGYSIGILDNSEEYYEEETKEAILEKEIKKEIQQEKKEEPEDIEPEKKKSHGALKFLVAILIILVLMELFILAMNNFAPDSAITQTLNDGIRSITKLISYNDVDILDVFMA